jgi:hypothetical protein
MSPRGIGHDEFAVDEDNEILQAFFRTDRFQQHLFFLPVKWQTLPACEPDDFDDTAGKNPASARVFGVNSGHRTVTGRTADDKRPLDLVRKHVYSSIRSVSRDSKQGHHAMPHLFTNRQRRHDLSAAPGQAGRQFVWETVNAVLYKIGGVVFIIGSVLFFPRFEAYADLGAWTFFFGSLLYLVVTGHDAIEVWRYRRDMTGRSIRDLLEVIAAGGYLIGTLLFAIGSILFLSSVGLTTDGAWFFVFGSLLFVIAASVNVLQIVEASSLRTLQLMNLTAVSFVAGSVLFTVASIPYLWSIDSAADQREIDAYLAWQYLFGSALFLLGGVFNYWRACLVIHEHKQDGTEKA